MNLKAVKALYFNELKRAKRTIGQTVLSPVISTSLYFVIFGSALGARIQEVEGISYASFIVPGLMMLTVLNQSVTGASFSLYLPRLTGAIYEVLCAPLSYFEIALAYIAAATTRAMVVGLIILGTSRLFIPFDIAHPSIMLLLLLLTCVTFSMLGFIIGLWADSFEKIEIVPRLIITPLSFLGGSFYSIDMLSPL
ncbi:MAG: ABC transporter permease, partial [Deltaproteobacteria bacterium]|nr:ABC transporter permease [Deltaproteobacteria bacterium]